MFPEIQLSDSIVVPTYLLYLSILYCFLIYYVTRRAKSRESFLATDSPVTLALDLGLIMMVAGFIGGRLVHVFYEMPGYYAQDWIRILRFWEGGFVFYGGFLLAFVCCLLFLWKKKLSFGQWADFYAPVLALGYGLGRMSCFLAGCCYGRTCDAPWAVAFPWDPQQILRHPVQIYSVLWELCAFALLILLERQQRIKLARGSLFFIWLTLHALGRLMMEYYREDFRGDMIWGLTISTWISFALLIFSVAALVQRLLLNPKSKRF